MKLPPRILIADRSELAGNIFRLLLSPLGATLIVSGKFEDVEIRLSRREAVNLVIFNSNTFRGRSDDIVERIMETEALKKAKKIFVCKDSDAERPLTGKLSRLPNSRVIIRPFCPDEFVELVRKLLK